GPLAKERPRMRPADFINYQAQIAAAADLRVVKGKIPLPDLRIEYTSSSGAAEHSDLEQATKNYRAGQLKSHAQAGFKTYASGQNGSPGRTDYDSCSKVWDDHDITGELLSL